jgi:hypothetical protein
VAIGRDCQMELTQKFDWIRTSDREAYGCAECNWEQD